MGKLIGWLGIAGLALLLAFALLWTIVRATGPGEAQREALALLREDWNPPGSNAFDALWLLPYPVPEQELAAITDADMARMSATPDVDANGEGGIGDFTTSAAEAFADQTPPEADRELFCQSREDDCLERVRADLPGYRALLERHAPLLERIAALERHGHVRNRLPPRIDTPFPPFQHGRYRLTQHAVAFAEGKVDVALDGTCREFDTWRRLGANSDSLIMRMIGIAYSTGAAGRLLADMLSELPPAYPLPVSCRTALRSPEPEDLSICRAMRGEFAYSVAAMRSAARLATASKADAWWLRRAMARAGRELFFNPDKTIAAKAPFMAAACTAEQRQRIAADLPGTALPGDTGGTFRLQCLDNAIGCVLNEIAVPAYMQYQDRALDQGARLQLLGTLLWLRDHAGDRRPLAARLAERPPELRSPERDIEVGEDGSSLRIRQYFTGDGKVPYWEVPLPAALAETATD